MALLDDILAWTISDLSLWQRDAERRLFQKEAGLSIQDYDELYVLLRAAHGLPNPLMGWCFSPKNKKASFEALLRLPLRAIHLR